ncbi:ABC transporter substrate-binding protein [Microbacterium sp.]|uniref:ABC transporter substrate-binding protein n=1 Tax=Microbacterium sp. TaxID=51671 RepID=UPI003F9D7D94
MKKLLGVTAVVVVAGSLIGCSGPAASDDEVLTVWGWRTDKPWVELMESYKGDGFTVDYKSYKAEEYNQILQTGLSSSTGPDIVMLRSYGGLDTLVAGGGVAALDEDFAGLAEIPDNLVDGVRSSKDGKVYGVPFQSVTANVIYNKTQFDALGLSEPATWSEFIALNDELLAQGVTPMAAGALDSWILPIYRDLFAASAYGGPAFAAELLAGETTFEDDRYTEANQTLLDLTKYFPRGFEGINYADANALFISGEALQYPGGIWELTAFNEAMPDVELGLFNVPSVSGGEDFAMGYLDGAIGMASGLEGKKLENAQSYLEWIGSTEFGQRIADDLLSIPAVGGVTPADPLMAKASEAFAASPTPYLTYVNFDFGTPTGTSLEYTGLQKMVIGDLKPAQVGAEVQAGIAQWFEPTP